MADDHGLVIRVQKPRAVMNVADIHVVQVVEELVIVIPRVVLKLLNPELQIRDDLPLGLPLLLEHPARRVLEVQAEEQRIRARVVLFDDGWVLDERGQEGLLEVVLG